MRMKCIEGQESTAGCRYSKCVLVTSVSLCLEQSQHIVGFMTLNSLLNE